ncbi:MAG: STAS domain protein [Deltaproteobacteria bacterium ADurb.Bin510]|nr:MAG: STAS domain protein [Deltaproteobacteria bacterium ADurb.Bin510]
MAGISSEQTQEGLRLKIAGEANILQAGAFRDEALQAIEAGQALSLDLSAVTSIDLAFVQVVLAAQRACQAQGLEFALCAGAPPAFSQLLKSAALENHVWQTKA